MAGNELLVFDSVARAHYQRDSMVRLLPRIKLMPESKSGGNVFFFSVNRTYYSKTNINHTGLKRDR